jgi:acetolactate synthase I/II/III large subunit
MTTTASAIVALLKGYGVDTVFGIPGVHTIELYRGIVDSGLRHVTPRHEQGAGFMADGYARSTGKPGVCFLISGPGLTNALTAIAQAYSDSVPMLIISAVHKRKDIGLGRGFLHELPAQRELMSQVCAFSHTIMDPGNLREVLGRAFAIFGSARPRPVHIEVPIDLMDAPYSGLLEPIAIPAAPYPDPRAIAQAAALLADARAPAIIAGGGAAGASAALLATAELLDAPVVLTTAAKGALRADHPLCLGSTIRRSEIRELFADSDVVLAVGSELGETDRWMAGDSLTTGGTLIRIDIESEQLMRMANPTLGIVSDARAALQALNLELGERAQFAQRSKGASRVESVRQRMNPGWRDDTGLHALLMKTIADSVADDAIVAADSTQIVYTGVQDFPSMQPRSWLTSCTGFGTLGYALPAAIGAKLANPDRDVLCLIGDGGLMFTVAELATAVDENIAFPIIVWNNGGYGEIALYMDKARVPRCGVGLYVPDLCAIALAFGCNAERPTSLDALKAAIVRSFSASAPTLIDIDHHAPYLRERAF